MELWKLLFVLMNLGTALSQQVCGNDGKMQITETEVDSEITNVYWIPPTFQVLYATTAKWNLYRSEDGGKTWISQLPYMQGAEEGDPSGVYSVHLTSNPNVVYFLGFSDRLWITTDGGNSYQTVATRGNKFVEVSTHPTHPDWLLAADFAASCFTNDPPPNSPPCNRRLWLTTDGGKGWTMIDTYVYIYTWANAGATGVPDKTMWVLDWPDKTGPQYSVNGYLQKSISDVELRHSVDFLATTIEHPIDNVVFFLYLRENMYFARLASNTLELYVSEDNGQNFRKANFPFSDLMETQYSILDDTEGQVFMSVAHGSYQWGNIYSSDSLGSDYELSLQYCPRDRKGRSAFAKVQSLQGVYLGNSLQNVRGDNGDGAKSLITFDKGGDWIDIALPKLNDGNTVACDEIDCTLNLHLSPKRGENFFYSYGPVHSREEAVGLMIATGNAGTLLEAQSFDASDVHTYLTRDGGWTWFDIRNGSHIYEFADHGALIMMASNIHPTRSVVYTSDEGLTFTECQFTTGPAVEVHNIIVEPQVKAEEFLMHGVRSSELDDNKGVLVHFDFKTYFTRNCVYPDDYEDFVPHDSEGADHANCLLGQTIKYSRRKRNADCFNPDDYEKKTEATRCACTKEDYQCDFCFERSADGGACGRVRDCIPPEPQCSPEGFYNVSKGYRLVVGTQCDPSKGLDLLPTPVPCSNPHAGHKKLSPGVVVLIVFIVLAVVFGLIGSAFYVCRRNGSLQGFSTRTRIQKTFQYEEESTAFDDDLLEVKEADELDEHALSEGLRRNSGDSFSPRDTEEPQLFSL